MLKEDQKVHKDIFKINIFQLQFKSSLQYGNNYFLTIEPSSAVKYTINRNSYPMARIGGDDCDCIKLKVGSQGN